MSIDDRLRDGAAALHSAEVEVPPFRRVHRMHRIRRSLAATAAFAVALTLAAGAYAATGNRHAISVNPAGPSKVVSEGTTSWCVAISRDEALRRAVVYETVRPRFGAAIDQAKLVSGSEMLTQSEMMKLWGWGTGAGTSYAVGKRTKYWVIERHRPKNGQGPYAWGLVAIEANSGQTRVIYVESYPPTDNADTARTPRFFDTLPDHSSDCTNPRVTAP